MHRWITRAAGLAGLSMAAAVLPMTGTSALPAPHVPHIMLTRSGRAAVQPPPVSVGIETPSLGGLPFPGNMAYFGGPVMTTPKVYLIFWNFDAAGQDPYGVKSVLTNFFNGIGGSAYANVLTQYYETVNGANVSITNPSGQLAGVWSDDTNPIHDNLSAADYAAEANRALAHFGQSAPDPNASYVVATPAHDNDSGFNSGSYCAYHDFTSSSTYPGVTPGISFTVMPYIANAGGNCGAGLVNTPGTLDGVTMVAGHEYVESITDPAAGSGWKDTIGNENGDKCAYVTVGPGSVTNVTWSTGTFAVQGSWSNNGLSGLGSCATS